VLPVTNVRVFCLAQWMGLLFALPAHARADVNSCIHAADAGQKLRDSGSYLRAREQFIACAAEECPGEIRKGCLGWLAELEKLMPTVVFAARFGARELTDVRVSVDGAPLAERIDGKPVPLDPGEHRFRFDRAGAPPIQETAVLVAGEKERLVQARFAPEPVTPPSPNLRAGPEPEAPRKMNAIEYVLGGVGLASLATGIALDLSGYVFLQQCNGDHSCSGAHERAEVEWRFVTGDILLAVGMLSAAAAWLLWKQDTHPAPQRPGTSVAVRQAGTWIPGAIVRSSGVVLSF
jgi:hypothetical protein